MYVHFAIVVCVVTDITSIGINLLEVNERHLLSSNALGANLGMTTVCITKMYRSLYVRTCIVVNS